MDKVKPNEGERPPLLTSLILNDKFNAAYEILRIVYPECTWVWSADNLDGIEEPPAEVPRSPPSLVDTCLTFFRKSREVYEQRNVLSQLHFSTKTACLFCTNEPLHSPQNETLASALERPVSMEMIENSEESVPLAETETVQASTSTAVVDVQAAPTYLELLKLKKDELNGLGDESTSIYAYTNLSLHVKKEMTNGLPMAAVCSVTGTLHLKLMFALLKCGMHPSHPDPEKPLSHIRLKMTGKKFREDLPFMKLLLRYECFRFVADNVDFSLSTEQLKSSDIFQQFYLARARFQPVIWIDEHLKERLVRNVFDLSGHPVNCTKEDYIRVISDIFQVLCFMIKLSNVSFFAIDGDNSVLNVVFGCADLELGNIIADSGKLTFDFDSQLKIFLQQYKTLSTLKKRQMETLLKKTKFNLSIPNHHIPRALTAGHVELTKILMRFSNCATYTEHIAPGNPFTETFSRALPMFIVPLLRNSFWENHVRNWAAQIEDNQVTHPSDLQRAVDSIEHVLDVAIRPLLEDCIKDVFFALPLIMDIAKVSQYGFLKEDLQNMHDDLAYFVFGNRASLQALCVRRIFRNLVNRKILGFRSRSRPASDTVGPVVFPICVNNGTAGFEEAPLCGCNDCSNLGLLCPTCLEREWSITKNMLNAACDAAEIPRKFSAMLGMECCRYEVISRISCCAGSMFTKMGPETPPCFLNRPRRFERLRITTRARTTGTPVQTSHYRPYADFDSDTEDTSTASSDSDSSLWNSSSSFHDLASVIRSAELRAHE